MSKFEQLAVAVIFSIIVVAMAEFKIYMLANAPQEVVTESYDIFELEPEEIPILDGGDPDSDIPLIRTTAYVRLTLDEMDLLESIAMAEAEGEDARGKALVMRVVLNRSLEWNKPIDEIIYSPNQFATYRMDIEPTEDCHEALAIVIDGWDESEGAIWFNADDYPKYGSPLFQYGGHYFSK